MHYTSLIVAEMIVLRKPYSFSQLVKEHKKKIHSIEKIYHDLKWCAEVTSMQTVRALYNR